MSLESPVDAAVLLSLLTVYVTRQISSRGRAMVIIPSRPLLSGHMSSAKTIGYLGAIIHESLTIIQHIRGNPELSH